MLTRLLRVLNEALDEALRAVSASLRTAMYSINTPITINRKNDSKLTAIPAAPAPNPPDSSSTMTLLSGDLRRVPVKKIVKKGSIHTFEDVSVPIAEALTEKEFVQIKKIHSYEDKPYKEDKKEEKLTLTLTFKPKMQPLETEIDQKEEPSRGHSLRRSTCVIS